MIFHSHVTNYQRIHLSPVAPRAPLCLASEPRRTPPAQLLHILDRKIIYKTLQNTTNRSKNREKLYRETVMCKMSKGKNNDMERNVLN